MNGQDYTSLESAHDMFLSYLYQYLVLSGCHQSAHTLVKEARVQLKSDVSGAYLYDFWCLLWNLHSSSRLANPMPPPPLPGSRMYSIAESRVANGPENAQFRAPPGAMRPGFVQQAPNKQQGQLQMQQLQMQQQQQQHHQHQQQQHSQQHQHQHQQLQPHQQHQPQHQQQPQQQHQQLPQHQQQQQQQALNQQHLQQLQIQDNAQPIMIPGHPPLVVRKGYPQGPSGQKASISPSYGHQELPLSQNSTGSIPQDSQYMPGTDRALYGQAQYKASADGGVNPVMANMPLGNNGMNGMMPGKDLATGNANGMAMNPDASGMAGASGVNGMPMNNMNGAPMNGLILDMAMAMGSDLGMEGSNSNNMKMNPLMGSVNGGNNGLGNVNMGMGGMPGTMGGGSGMALGADPDNNDLLFGTPLAMSF